MKIINFLLLTKIWFQFIIYLNIKTEDILHMKILMTQQGITADYAAIELQRLIIAVSEGKINPIITIADSLGSNDPNTIKLALLSELNLSEEGVDDPVLDDITEIDITGLNGYIAGSNIRAILIGVYQFMHSAGCRFVRPGKDGEYLPACDLLSHSCKQRNVPSYRIRGECIEGAVSLENCLETIVWSPKVGFNSFMLEFMIPFTFFDNWYSHRANTVKTPEPLSVERAALFTSLCEQETKKCGLLLHSAGHGWTCEPFGVPGLKWSGDVKYDIESVRENFAMLNGVRDLYHNVPLNTNLCYSNPKTRRTVVEYCAKYAKEKHFIDILHIWLADGTNNHCECDECVKMDPVEFYIMLMNEIDEEFERQGITMKLVFLIYVDLLWAPKIMKLNKSNRFTCLFAPITRDYTQPYTTEPFTGTLPEFVRNKLQFPRDMTENLAHLKEWQKMFNGTSFVYEYHFWTYHCHDYSYYDMARILLEDIKRLGDLGLHGMLEDGTQRAFFPTGFPMYLCAKSLYNKDLTFDEIADEYFIGSFGDEGLKAKEYIAGLAELFEVGRIYKGTWAQEDSIEKIKKVPVYVNSHLALIYKNLKLKDSCHAKSWELLKLHANAAIMLSQAMVKKSEGDTDSSKKIYSDLQNYLSVIEDDIQELFDLDLFNRVNRGKFQ